MTTETDRPSGIKGKSVAKSNGDEIDTRLVRKLADILKETDLSEIEVERGDLHIRVARHGGGGAPFAAPPMMQAPAQFQNPAPTAAPAAIPAPAGPAPAPSAARTGELLKSPMVGTVYLQSQPGAPAFAKVGDKVTEGQTLLIIEAMKTMNPIPAPHAGTVAEILVDDGQPVEFGEPLVVLE